tara:strand:- start:133 stop:471 length:339 start_codon:yes stop_codon:yes gene_type:complete
MIIKQTGSGIHMARILIAGECEDEELFAEALAEYGRRDVYWAVDNTVANKYKAEALGIDSRLNLVGSDADEDLFSTVLGLPTPKPKSKKSNKTPKALDKEVEAVVNESEKVL